MPKKSVGKTNRRKGHNAERYYANFFKDLGYTFCKTARQASRLHDDCGIDLIFAPVSFIDCGYDTEQLFMSIYYILPDR